MVSEGGRKALMWGRRATGGCKGGGEGGFFFIATLIILFSVSLYTEIATISQVQILFAGAK